MSFLAALIECVFWALILWLVYDCGRIDGRRHEARKRRVTVHLARWPVSDGELHRIELAVREGMRRGS